jgi:hypothetical protein
LKGVILPVFVLALLTCFDAQISTFLHLDTLVGQENSGVLMGVLQGLVIIAILPITYFNTKWLYKKGKIKVEARKQPPDDSDSA